MILYNYITMYSASQGAFTENIQYIFLKNHTKMPECVLTTVFDNDILRCIENLGDF